MVLQTYFIALKNFEDKIPYDYFLKEALLEKTDYIKDSLLHTAPEVISMVYSNLCKNLIECLPPIENRVTKYEDEWAVEAWKFITESAIEVNKIIVNKKLD
jgi:hypothetical protein